MTLRLKNVFTALALASCTAPLSLASCSREFAPRADENSGGSGAGTAGSSGESGAPAESNGDAGDSSGAAGEANSAGGGAGGAHDAQAGVSGNPSHAPGDGGSAGDAAEGDAGAGGEAGAGFVCDPTKSPAHESCVIDEAYGVFVSPGGDDEAGDGSRAQPFATLARGIAEASASHKRVYACADGGAYAESLYLDAAASGLEMYGGFSCTHWEYDVARKSAVAGSSVTALRVWSVEGLHVEDFEFEGADGAQPGESSVAAWIYGSIGVKFMRTVVRAGNGADGAAGMISPFEYPSASSLRGNSPTSGQNGMSAGEKRCECQTPELFSVGGAGGPQADGGGTAGLPDHGGGAPGPSGATSCVLRTGNEILGVPGVGGNAPAAVRGAGATATGFVDRTGFHAANGENGATAGPGQGGGGGARVTQISEGKGTFSRGGGGGCGGCGGNGGGGGRGGGASIALFVIDSEVVLSASVLVAANGGAGGRGQAGQEGQVGGAGGSGVGAGCSGGKGGTGGRGGAGGGGAGGISAGLVWIGSASPIFDASYVLKGEPGAAGIGGEPGVNDGVPGVSREVLEAN